MIPMGTGTQGARTKITGHARYAGLPKDMRVKAGIPSRRRAMPPAPTRRDTRATLVPTLARPVLGTIPE